MSWGIERDELEHCPCGKEFIRVVQERDDWGWYRETQTMLCEDCKKRYVQKVFRIKGGRYITWVLKSGE